MRNAGFLKKIRIVISLLFFLFTIILFLDITGLFGQNFYKTILYLQFVPSLLKLLSLGGIIAGGFIIVIIINLFFGRIYCSTICPLGTLQDIIIFLSGKLKISKKFTKQRTFNYLKYSFLIITVFAFIFGQTLLINLLDPYSSFGKISTNLFRPVYIFINNILAFGFQKFDIYYFYRIHYTSFSLLAFIYSAIFFVIIALMSVRWGRLFCNTVCPVGSLLSLLSKLSIYKISIDSKLCNSCTKCAINCKTGCIDVEKQKINFSECVACMNCISVCPSYGINFKKEKKKNKEIHSPSKRKFLKNSILIPLSVSIPSFNNEDIKNLKLTQNPEEKNYPVTPPGSVSIDHFTKLCTACHLCISACPTQVLQASFLEYGLGGMMQPHMDYHNEFCNYECTVCGEVCPTGAILALSVEKKKTTQLGKVQFIKENCIVETEGTDCGACSEHCPTKSVEMVPYNGLFLPEVNTDICIGCGACEYACPTEPYKAIFVDGNPVHEKVAKPDVKKIKEDYDPEEDFPF